jgi:H+/Cl- antiporter ClcA
MTDTLAVRNPQMRQPMQRSLFALPFYCLLGIFLAGFVSITFIKSISYVGAGFSGGIFAPSLVLGVLLGGILDELGFGRFMGSHIQLMQYHLSISIKGRACLISQ